MIWSLVATAMALVLAGYLALTDWIDLAPWNNVEDLPVRQKLLISIANYTLLMQIAYWRVPYLRGATEVQKQEHAKLFGGTTTFLPPIGDHPIPNAEHVVVGIMMLAMVVATGVNALTILH